MMRRIGLALATSLLCAGCAQQPPAPVSLPVANIAYALKFSLPETEVAAMSDLYRRICLDSFPAPAATTAALASLAATPMSPAEVKAYLHDDTGHGYHLRQNGARYELTLEDPPYRTCALRRMTPIGPATSKPYIATLQAYAATHGMRLAAYQRQQQNTGGLQIVSFSYVLAPPGADTAHETSLLILTNYKGLLDLAKWPEATGGLGVELRMAHQFTPPIPLGPETPPASSAESRR